jgi:hypothetical protein
MFMTGRAKGLKGGKGAITLQGHSTTGRIQRRHRVLAQYD